jgi:hypothetical protein
MTTPSPPDAAPAEPCVCSNGVATCSARGPKLLDELGLLCGLLCTRPLGHDGDHVACGSTEHRLATWPQMQR